MVVVTRSFKLVLSTLLSQKLLKFILYMIMNFVDSDNDVIKDNLVSCMSHCVGSLSIATLMTL